MDAKRARVRRVLYIGLVRVLDLLRVRLTDYPYPISGVGDITRVRAHLAQTADYAGRRVAHLCSEFARPTRIRRCRRQVVMWGYAFKQEVFTPLEWGAIVGGATEAVPQNTSAAELRRGMVQIILLEATHRWGAGLEIVRGMGEAGNVRDRPLLRPMAVTEAALGALEPIPVSQRDLRIRDWDQMSPAAREHVAGTGRSVVEYVLSDLLSPILSL